MGPHHGMPGNYNVRPINSGYPPQGYVMHQQQRYPVMYQQVPQVLDSLLTYFTLLHSLLTYLTLLHSLLTYYKDYVTITTDTLYF